MTPNMFHTNSCNVYVKLAECMNNIPNYRTFIHGVQHLSTSATGNMS